MSSGGCGWKSKPSNVLLVFHNTQNDNSVFGRIYFVNHTIPFVYHIPNSVIFEVYGFSASIWEVGNS
jgi:hypothetical protein